ncbi:MAG: zinc ribbon domain-containing protein [Desulfobulbaceae bacterium]|nr:zinc ribbon domain-containing protein [Desulfobulbaceae bacterium]
MLDYDACMRYAKEEHFCPHCKTRLSCCETPPFHVGDGLGWGCDVLFVCLNDECPLFANSWKRFEEQYGHSSACRYMLVPGETVGSAMMVQGKAAFTGSIIDPEAIKAQNKRYADEQVAVAQFDTCVADKNLAPVLSVILDEKADPKSRKLACELLPKINDLSCIDALRNHKFGNEEVLYCVNIAISLLLKANFKKECPHCMEVVKAQAKVCMHCNKELA